MGIMSFILGMSANNNAFADTSKFVVIDVRTPQEYADSHVVGAENIDFYEPAFQETIAKLDKNKTYKLYCRSGNRSGQAERMMKSMGFKDVENIGSLQQAADRLKAQCTSKC